MGILIGYFNDQLINAQDWLIRMLELYLGLRSPDDTAFETIVYGLSWGYADKIAVYVAVTLLFVAMFRRGYFRNFTDALIVLFVISIAGGGIFGLFKLADQLEGWLADKASWHDGPTKSADLLQVSISEVFFSMLGLALVAAMCFMVVAGFVFADLLSFAAKTLFLPSAALTPLADAFKKFFSILLSAIIVADVFGKPGAIYVLNVGMWAKDNWAFGRTGFGSYVITVCTIALMGVVLLLIAKAAYNAPTAVKGWIEGKTSVSDEVNAKLQPDTKVDARVVHEEFSRSHQGTPVPVVVTQPASSLRDQARDAAVDRAAFAVKAVVAGNATPVVAAVASPVIDKGAGKLKTKS